MKYALLIYGDEVVGARMTPEEQQTEIAEYNAFTEDIRQRGLYAAGEALHPTSSATTVRVRAGKTISTDGPFAETKEQLGGFYIVDCKDLDEAIQTAAKIPTARNGSIEIRPIMIFDN
jgi:hypothetical protein